MRPATQRLTADDVWRIPLRPGIRGYELVNGELVEVMPASLPHGRIGVNIGRELGAFLDASPLGRIYWDGGFVLQVPGDPERLRGPDVAFVSNATLDAAGGEPETGWARFAPDLAIEIDSPSNTKQDVQDKVKDYLDAGVDLVWVIHPRSRTATVYHPDGSARLLREDDELDGENVLPGFRVIVKDLLA